MIKFILKMILKVLNWPVLWKITCISIDLVPFSTRRQSTGALCFLRSARNSVACLAPTNEGLEFLPGIAKRIIWEQCFSTGDSENLEYLREYVSSISVTLYDAKMLLLFTLTY